jgi:Cu/Ag efflux protein CusF
MLVRPRPAQCNAAPPLRIMQHAMTGYVPEMNRITVRKADIPGMTASMVMDYKVKDSTALAGIKSGDVIKATMVMDDVYWLENIKVTGKR